MLTAASRKPGLTLPTQAIRPAVSSSIGMCEWVRLLTMPRWMLSSLTISRSTLIQGKVTSEVSYPSLHATTERQESTNRFNSRANPARCQGQVQVMARHAAFLRVSVRHHGRLAIRHGRHDSPRHSFLPTKTLASLRTRPIWSLIRCSTASSSRYVTLHTWVDEHLAPFKPCSILFPF